MPSLVQTLSRQCTEYSVQDTVWTVQDPPPVGQLALALAGHTDYAIASLAVSRPDVPCWFIV